MSIVTVCPAVFSSGVGWSATGAAMNTAINDGSDLTYAGITAGLVISAPFVATFDTSLLPHNAVISDVSFYPRLGLGVDAAGESGALVFFLTYSGGTLDSDSLSYSWAGIPAVRQEDLLIQTTNIRPGGAPFSRADLDSVTFTMQGQASSGDVQLYVYYLTLSVTWSARSGGVL